MDGPASSTFPSSLPVPPVQGGLIVVSNRLPYIVTHDGEGHVEVVSGSGGLISALVPVLRRRGGMWIGWPGATADSFDLDDALADVSARCGYALKPVHLTQDEVHKFYHGFSNEVVWPLFHDLQSVCNFEPEYWRTYRDVNRKFAQVVLAHTRDDQFIWVHDYHLMNVGHELRASGCRAKLGFFLHIPFPSVDLFSKLPWCAQLIEALLEYDLIGFQTHHDRRNFLGCVRALARGAQVEGKGSVASVTRAGRRVHVGTFPISIDFGAIVAQAAKPEIAHNAARLHTQLPNRKLMLGVDRLDYTKGIPQRLQAFQSLLRRSPQMRERIS